MCFKEINSNKYREIYYYFVHSRPNNVYSKSTIYKCGKLHNISVYNTSN